MQFKDSVTVQILVALATIAIRNQLHQIKIIIARSWVFHKAFRRWRTRLLLQFLYQSLYIISEQAIIYLRWNQHRTILVAAICCLSMIQRFARRIFQHHYRTRLIGHIHNLVIHIFIALKLQLAVIHTHHQHCASLFRLRIK